MYKNIISKPIAQYNAFYKTICKAYPSWSIRDKQSAALQALVRERGLDLAKIMQVRQDPFSYSAEYQYFIESFAVSIEIQQGINRYYIRDESLFDFFKNTEIRQKEVEAILDSDVLDNPFGVIGQSLAFTLICLTTERNDKVLHIITVLTDDMNYTFCVEEFNKKVNGDSWAYNMAMNFLFYIRAFPECVIDGVPNGVKRNPRSKVISTSDKIVSHTTVEHGFVRPHFRSGYFRHLNSDYFVNCKGQVRFIASTMVKGKAKTVISRGE